MLFFVPFSIVKRSSASHELEPLSLTFLKFSLCLVQPLSMSCSLFRQSSGTQKPVMFSGLVKSVSGSWVLFKYCIFVTVVVSYLSICRQIACKQNSSRFFTAIRASVSPRNARLLSLRSPRALSHSCCNSDLNLTFIWIFKLVFPLSSFRFLSWNHLFEKKPENNLLSWIAMATNIV